MEYVKLGTHRPRRVADLPRLHELRRARPRHAPLVARRGGEPAAHPGGARRRHQLLRHRQRLLRRHQRGDRRAGRSRDFADRDEIVIATKVHGRMRQGPNGGGLSRKAIMTEIDASLRRLGTDYVDLYQIHRWDPTTPIEETLEALHDVVKAGKARYIGASSMWAWQFAKALYVADRQRLDPVRLDAEPLQPALPRGGAGDAAALRRPGRRRHPVEPARARPAHPGLGRRPPRGPRPTSSARRLYRRRPTGAIVERVGRDRGRARRVAGRRSRWPGCCATRSSTAPIVGATKPAPPRRRRRRARRRADRRGGRARSRSPTCRTPSPATLRPSPRWPRCSSRTATAALFISTATVVFGVVGQAVARGWLARDLTGTNTGLGGVMLVFGLAMLIATPWGASPPTASPKRLGAARLGRCADRCRRCCSASP